MIGPFSAKWKAQSSFVSQVLQTVVRTRQRTQDEACLREAAEIVALCQQIEEMPWLEEGRIKDDDSSRQHSFHKVTTGIQKHAPPGNAQLTRINSKKLANKADSVSE